MSPKHILIDLFHAGFQFSNQYYAQRTQITRNPAA